MCGEQFGTVLTGTNTSHQRLKFHQTEQASVQLRAALIILLPVLIRAETILLHQSRLRL